MRTEKNAKSLAMSDVFLTFACDFLFIQTDMETTTTQTRRLTRAERIAINSQIPARTKRMVFARAHKGALTVLDPDLRAKLRSYND